MMILSRKKIMMTQKEEKNDDTEEEQKKDDTDETKETPQARYIAALSTIGDRPSLRLVDLHLVLKQDHVQLYNSTIMQLYNCTIMKLCKVIVQ